MGNVYGYVRVSSKDQNEDRQVITMREMQVPEENIFIIRSGVVLVLNDSGALVSGRVPVGDVLVDGLGVGDVSGVALDFV